MPPLFFVFVKLLAVKSLVIRCLLALGFPSVSRPGIEEITDRIVVLGLTLILPTFVGISVFLWTDWLRDYIINELTYVREHPDLLASFIDKTDLPLRL